MQIKQTANPSGTRLIDGPVGKLELLIEQPKEPSAKPVLLVCCHPHPLHGGSMSNKVVHTLARAGLETGLYCIRFNFRGVGGSEGKYAEGIGELEDLRYILHWVKQQYPEFDVWIGGFSFGAYISLKMAELMHFDRVFSIAPPVGRFISQDMTPLCHHWLIVHGGKDELIEQQLVEDWVKAKFVNHKSLEHKSVDQIMPDVRWLPDASHFFHGQLVNLKNILIEFIQSPVS